MIPEIKRLAGAAMILAAALTPQNAAASDCVLEKGRIKAGGVCLAVEIFAKPQAPGRPMAIVVHGDGGGSIRDGYLRLLRTTGKRIAEAVPGAGVVFVQRPGYRSDIGESEGHAKSEDDDYTPENVKHMADAVAALKQAWRPSRVVWVGHSGGSALGALVLGRYPGTVDAAVLVGCPCGEIKEWRQHRNFQRGRHNASLWPASLSPIAHQDGLRAGLPVVLLTGDKDDNTLPRFAQAWAEKAKARGVDARFVSLPGAGHGKSAGAPEVAEHAARLMK